MAGTGGAAEPVAQAHKGYEGPPYAVELAEGAFELRRYGPHVVAEVRVEGDRDGALGAGFRVLAGYIFGGNRSRAKIAMTAPVAQTPSETIAMTAPVGQSPAGTDLWTVTFTMPAGYTLATLPVPNDARIRLVEAAGDRQAVVRFSGFAGARRIAAEEARLRNWMAGRGIAPVAGPHVYYYDAPMTLPWNRRNEVAFTIE